MLPDWDDRLPATALGEGTLNQLAVRAEDYRILSEAVYSPRVSRHRSAATQEIRDRAAIIDCIALTEDFCVKRLRLADRNLAENHLNSWQKRQSRWRLQTHERPMDESAWATVRAFVDARNALQHGQGHLTEQQLGLYRSDILKRLRAASGIQLTGDRVFVGSDAVANCVKSARSFILDLDLALPCA